MNIESKLSKQMCAFSVSLTLRRWECLYSWLAQSCCVQLTTLLWGGEEAKKELENTNYSLMV